MDDPVFPDTIRIAEQHTARILPIPVGTAGLDVDALAWRLRSGQRIKALYTVPDFHNPSGGVLPAVERDRLVELAEQYGFVIVSDNPYREYGFSGPAGTGFLSRFRSRRPGRHVHQDAGPGAAPGLGRRAELVGTASGEPPAAHPTSIPPFSASA